MDFNNWSLEQLSSYNEATGVAFVVEDGEITDFEFGWEVEGDM